MSENTLNTEEINVDETNEVDNVEETDEIEEAPNFAPLTPYAAHEVVNKVLAAKGIDKVITPQMMYSYAKKEVIATVSIVGSKKVFFDGNAFKIWLDRYVSALLTGNSGAGRQDYDKLAEQYM